jgi:hypothetical protein
MRGIFWIVMLLIPVAVAWFGIDWFAYRGMPRLLPQFRIDGDAMTKFDPEIGFVARPDSSSVPHEENTTYNVYTDHRGARVSAPGEQTARPLDVMFLGDSFTWGHGVEETETFPHLAAKQLKLSGANFALFAWGTVQSLQMLRRNQDLKPRIVVYSFVMDNLRRNVTPCAPGFYPFCYDVSYAARGQDGALQIRPPHGNGVERVRLQLLMEQGKLDPLARVVHGVDLMLSKHYQRTAFRLGLDVAEQNAAFDFLLGQLAGTCKDIGAELLVVFIPQRSGEPPTPATTDAIAKHGLAYLDVSDALRQKPHTDLYLANGHLNPAGHQIVAREIASKLTRFARQ